MESTATARRKVLVMLCIAYCIGAIFYSGLLGWEWWTERRLAQRPWWQHLLAPCLVVLTWLALEVIGIFAANSLSISEATQGNLRRIAGFIGMLLLLAVLIIGFPLYPLNNS